jgi:hypothetical protein
LLSRGAIHWQLKEPDQEANKQSHDVPNTIPIKHKRLSAVIPIADIKKSAHHTRGIKNAALSSYTGTGPDPGGRRLIYMLFLPRLYLSHKP